MFRPRIIPVLLLKGSALVKSIQFKKLQYIGDPINAVKIFNDLKADELIILDIEATHQKRLISIEFIQEIGEEANMPFGVGGGVRTLKDIENIIKAGAEKVIINTYAAQNPDFIKQAADTFGSSTISVCMDFKKNIFGKTHAYTQRGQKSTGYSPLDFAKLMEDKGVGELIIQSIQRDGMMSGYDIEQTQQIARAVNIPTVALGGAGKFEDLKDAYLNGNTNGLAAGSLFVFHDHNKGVLINYPERNTLNFKR
jgi:cyclase